ncbi:MAG: hypothetical protein QOH21_1005 [Acidobacteriota bacterium]|nr:hypothetical protein [Acidobacteriota bacterium]
MRISAAWQRIEIESVKEGLRACALTLIPAWYIFELAAALAPDFEVLTVQTLAATEASYQAFETERWKPGSKLNLRVAIGRTSDVRGLADAFARRDDLAIGKLLGFPECCVAFFQRVCVDGGSRDTTWAAATRGGASTTLTVEVAPTQPANLLLRWLGVRLVPHLACGFDCAATDALGRKFMVLGRDAGFRDEIAWSEEILSWPVEWSALHGIAEIRTPVVKVVTSSDDCDGKRIVRAKGTAYPAEGARGLAFPYSRSVVEEIDRGTAAYRDNGFSTVEAMDAAHAPLVDLAVEALAQQAGPVLDLGCGNGLLLDKIRQRLSVPIHGVDADADKIHRARSLYPAGTFMAGDLFTSESIWQRSYALALISAARIHEASDDAVSQLATSIALHASRLILYAYGDTPFHPERLAAQCGLQIVGRSATKTAVLCEPAGLHR